MLDFSALFLIALIQGITEFLPVSSSGHLVLIPHITAFADQGQMMDVAAHIGTLAAVILYLRRDIIAMLASLFAPTVDKMRYRRLTGLLIIASLPVIIAGLLLELAGAEFLRLVWIVASANLVFALWLWVADRRDIQTDLSRSDTRQPEWEKLSYRHALYIGLAQICALIPGASRSGVTMTMARQLGYDRLSAARFSLLLSIPVIAGAGVLKGVSLYRTGEGVDILSLGLVAGLSFIFALLAIRWMMGWLAQADFRIFVFYRLGLGIVLLGLLGLNIL
jgi:undecaprenyl-diphosphatase